VYRTLTHGNQKGANGALLKVYGAGAASTVVLVFLWDVSEVDAFLPIPPSALDPKLFSAVSTTVLSYFMSN